VKFTAKSEIYTVSQKLIYLASACYKIYKYGLSQFNDFWQKFISTTKIPDKIKKINSKANLRTGHNIFDARKKLC